MDSFLKIVVSAREKFEIVNFGRNVILDIEKKAVQHLKLKSISELRDKFEGQTFFTNFSTILLTEMAVKKTLGLNYADVVPSKAKETVLNIDGTEILLITAQYGEFPFVGENEKRNVIFTIRKNELSIWICGLATPKILKENQVNKNASSERVQKGKMVFDQFDKLIPFHDMEELKAALKKK